jgi:hypothetical protein
MSQELNVLGPFTPCGLSSVPSPSGDSLIHGSEARYFLFESEASEHRLDKTALGYSTRDEAYQSKVGLGADGVFAAVNAEEEILVHQNTVVWSSGGCVRKSFTISRPIIQAMLVSFDMETSKMEDSTDKPSYAGDLCALHSEGLYVFCADGKTFSVVTPFEMEKMWPLPTGLLLQRAPSNARQTVAPIQGISVKADDDDAPTLFSLLHPLEEIRPVSYLDHRSTLAASFVPAPAPSTRTPKHQTPKTPGHSEVNLESQLKELKQNKIEDSNIPRFICAPHLRLIYSSADVPLLVFYNTKTMLHSIWLIRKAPKVVETIPSPLDPLDPLVSPATTSNPLDSFQSSFQEGYTRDLSWGPEQSAPRPIRSDLRLEHLYTEIPRTSTDPKLPRTLNEGGALYEGSAPATQVFLLVTPEAHLRLGFMLTEQKALHLYQLSSEEDEEIRNLSTTSLGSSGTGDSDPSLYSTLKVTRKRTLPCLAAIPLRVVDPLVLRVANKNIRLCPSYLVLELDRKIAIYSMNDRICECILPQPLFNAGSEPTSTPSLKTFNASTPVIHRTPSSNLFNIRNLRQNSITETPRASGKIITPARSLFPRSSGLGSSRRLIQSPIIFSPMTPGSPFPINSSDTDISLSALDLDMSIDQILLQASPATPMRPSLPQRSSTLGNIVLDTPAKSNNSLFATPLPSSSSIPVPTRLNFTDTEPSPSGIHVVDILQPVSNRFSVLFNDGRVFRLSLKIAPSSPIVLDCFRAATSLLTHTVWNTLLSEYLAFKHKLQNTRLGDFDLFSLFLPSLLPVTPELIEKELSTKKKSLSSSETLIDVDDNDWNFLLNSSFHASKMEQAPYQVLPTASDLFSTTTKTSQTTSSNTSSENIATSFISFVSRLKDLGVANEKIDATLLELANWHRRPKAAALRPFVSSLIHTTHLLCENYKLSILTIPLSRQLGRLLLDMAVLQGWKEYAQFYAHWLDMSLPETSFPDLTGLKDQKDSISVPRLEEPPSIMDWVRRCLVGFRETFPIMRESNQPCELTRKICRLYHILVHGPLEESDDIETYFEPFASLPISLGARMNKTPRTSPIKSARLKANQQLKWNVRARLVVVAMDEEFADLASLDSLPFGLTLPLREAIHSVKYHPPTNWPLSCYRFIGREDLAMQGLSFQKVAKSKYSIQDPYLSSSSLSTSSSAAPSTLPQGNSSTNPSQNSLEALLHTPHHPRSSGAQVDPNDPNTAANPNDAAESEMTDDGTDLTSPTTLMLFSQDERLAEVSRLLRSSYILQLVATEEIAHQSEAVQVHESYQKQMLFLIMRLLSLPIGRGMYTLSAELDHWGNAELGHGVYDELEDARDSSHAKQMLESKTVPTSVLKACARAEPLVVPHLPLKARRPDDRSILSVERVHGLVDWPEFHNGVAAGLRVPPADAEPISWQWIVSNRPKGALSCSHAGFLLAMGLQGHLKHIDPTGLYDYLSLVHPYTSASLLLGYSSCVYGLRSSLLTKVLQIHLPKPKRSAGGFSEPVAVDENTEMQVPHLVQCAALVSAGLGFAETNQRHHVESLLALLQHPHYNATCTESLGLSSGIGLGFICLGQGNNSAGLTDLDLLNRLCACIEGSKARAEDRSMESVLGAAHLVTTARTATGMMDVLMHNPTFAPNLLSQQSRPSQTAALPIYMGPFDHGVPARKNKPTNSHPSEKVELPVLVRHEPGIDKEVSAAGATIALGLIYLKTNNTLAAARVALPHNKPSALASIRPDIQLQRTLSKCLIMWDDIQPTQSWWEAQFPVDCLATGQVLLGPAWKRDPAKEKQDSFQLLKTAFMMVTGGASMALGLRFAGTSDRACISILSQNLTQMLKVQKSMSDRIDKKLAEMSILQIVLAWSLVQTGTGDLELLRILRKLRKKLGLDGKLAEGIYGYQMAIGMAIGFLFLGGGRYSISSSNKAIAALVTSLYCIWPLVPSDDKYHLQMLRHLYSLAIEPRCLEARDVDLLTPQFVPVRFWVRSPLASSSIKPHQKPAKSNHHAFPKTASTSISSATLASSSSLPKEDLTSNAVEVLEMTTPCLMPPRELIVKIEIASPHYWRSAFRPNHNKLHEHMLRAQNFVLVKKRHGSLQTSNSPIPNQPCLSALQLALSAPAPTGTPNYALSHCFSADPTLTAFAGFLLSETSFSGPPELGSGLSDMEAAHSIQQWHLDVFQDQETMKLLRSCADEDKEKLIQTLLWLRRYATNGILNMPSVSDQLNVDMIILFYDAGIVDDYDSPIAPIDPAESSGMPLLTSFSSIGPSSSSLMPGPAQTSSNSSVSSSNTHRRSVATIPPLISPSLLQLVRSTHSRFQPSISPI